MNTTIRTAEVRNETDADRVAAYLPSNYTVARQGDVLVIFGQDVAGWTLDDYVIPRLASGLIFAVEVEDEQEDDYVPTCSICDGVGHGYPGAGPCPLEVTDYSGEPWWAQ